jgi:Tfp pilus assembly protein PilX
MKLVYCSNIKIKPIDERLSSPPGSATETGTALVVCMLILTAVTILGLVGIHAGVVDLHIATNHTQMGHGLYLAEGAALEGVQRLANATTTDLQDRSFFWYHSRSDLEAANLDLRCPAHWSTVENTRPIALQSTLGSDVQLAAVEWSLAAGSSMVATEPRLYLNRVYGRSTRFQADHLVEIGYQLRY